jgi:long-chain acyl-CoA synthetase
VRRPFPWEALYPRGVSWDAPVASGTLTALLDAAVAEHGERDAILFRGERITYRDLARRVERAAAALAPHVRPGDRVALLLPNTPWHPVAFFAVLRLGGVVVHLSPLDPPRAHARKLEDSAAKVLVTINLPPMLPAALALREAVRLEAVLVGEDAAGLPIPDGLLRLGADGPAPAPAIHENDLALLQYTGGTTGEPRAAMLTHRNLTSAVSIYRAWFRGTPRESRPGDRGMLVLPLFHIYALSAVLLYGLTNGATMLLRERFDPAQALRDIAEGCTHFSGVPTMWIALASHPAAAETDFSGFRSAFTGGAALPHEVGQRVQALTGVRLGVGWGMTETAPAGTTVLLDRDAEPGEIGVPLPGIELEAVDPGDPRRVLPPGEVGELRIRGPNVTSGYWRRPEETEAAFRDGWLLTGDLGLMRPDGRFVLVDRKKDMLISGGFNVYPRRIEDAIHEHPDVHEAAVIGVPDPYRGEVAHAFVVPREGTSEMTLVELRAFLADKLGRHEMPAGLTLCDSLPHTPVGKLDKRELRAVARPRWGG